jgi:protein arginine phosphatase
MQEATMNVLVVCTGNTCRSPMAEVILSSLGVERGVRVRSAGTDAAHGVPASAEAQRVAERHGLSLAAHRSTPIALELVDWADHVLVMEGYHKRVVERLGAAEKVTLLSEYGGDGEDIVDPIGGPEETYERLFSTLGSYLVSFLETEKAPKS